MKKLIYIAAPLFSAAEREFNARLKASLLSCCDVFLPQDDGDLLVDLIAAGVPAGHARERIFQRDIAAIDRCDIVLIVLDGRAVDEGAAFELGYGFARSKMCIALQTDPRRLLPTGNNPMIERPLEASFSSIDELAEWMRRQKGPIPHAIEPSTH